ncbi:MAG: hypothetical protein PHQ40_02880 [Anaerolineaceae bacterium]|nr:hypothetical protein [Anaerolineaceae bacterium]
MPVIRIKSKLHDYQAQIAPIQDYINQLSRIEHKIFIIDENVWTYYSKMVFSEIPDSEIIVFPVKEDIKTLESVQIIYDRLIERSSKRNLTLITAGGGILQDITGFVASTLYRGIQWVFIPTTLLAQADSCIGSKTSLNYRGYKNLIGSFYPPSQIWIDPSFINTLKIDDYYSGLGEVAKLHIMGGDGFTQWLIGQDELIAARNQVALQQAIQNSLEIKIGFIANDEFDLGRRNMLNFGHDFGHAIEAVTDFAIPHGQAVVTGILLANIIAVNRGLLSENKRRYLEEELLTPLCKVKPKASDLYPDRIIDAMGRDKKRKGKDLALIMLTEENEMILVNDLHPAEVSSALRSFEIGH